MSAIEITTLVLYEHDGGYWFTSVDSVIRRRIEGPTLSTVESAWLGYLRELEQTLPVKEAE